MGWHDSLQPIRIVTKSEAMNVCTATFIFATLSSIGKKCSLRVVQNYTKDEQTALLRENYPSFIFVGCSDPHIKTLFEPKNARFINTSEVYSLFKEVESAKDFAYILTIGYATKHFEHQQITIPDDILTAALQSGAIESDDHYQYTEINQKFLLNLKVKSSVLLQKLVDFSAMVEACSRMGKAPVAVSSLLDVTKQKKAFMVFNSYREEIDRALVWCDKQEDVINKHEGVIVVHVKDYVSHYLTGSIASHIAQQHKNDQLFVLVLASMPDNLIRVSLRVAGKKDVHVGELLKSLFDDINGEFGGDKNAAGGFFHREHEELFLSKAQKVLGQASVEEQI